MRPNRELEVASIFREHFCKNSLEKLSRDKARVVSDIISCRTRVLGGHISLCRTCGYEEQSYNSCWNRHCPKCQGGAAFEWVESRKDELLPVPYFHLVFTLPTELRSLCYQNKSTIYNLLFRASSEALQESAKSRYQAKLGFFGIIHSWNQELLYHPHVHHIVPGIGISIDNTRCIPIGSKRYLLPVQVLSKLFRGIFIYHLKRAYAKGKLKFFGPLEYLQNPRDFEHLLSKSARHNWVVYSKPPFGGPEHVLKYLAAYTHKVGISNSRLRSNTSTEVRFLARDRGNKRKKRIIKLSPSEFSRRFLLHLIPKGFRRIRYFGYLYNEKRKPSLELLRRLLPLPASAPPMSQESQKQPPNTCPHCSKGLMKLILVVKPHRSQAPHPPPVVPVQDSS